MLVLHGLIRISVSRLFPFAAFACGASRATRVSDTPTRVCLIVEGLLRVEFLVCVAHSLFIFLKRIRSWEGPVAVTKPRRPVARGALVESD